MFLTEGRIEAEVALKRKLIDSYDWHRAVWEAFPGHADDKRAFLTRIDWLRDTVRVYIVSEWLPQRPGWWPKDDRCWRTRQIPDGFFGHAEYAFQLCANPTRKIAKLDEQGNRLKNGRRDPLRSREDLVNWLVRKGEEGGFRPLTETLRIVNLGRRYFRHKSGPGMHTAVEYRGVLEVTDREKFRETFRKGIGPAKGFGFGLLLLAPVTE